MICSLTFSNGIHSKWLMNTVLYYSSITTAKFNAIKGIQIFNFMKNSDLDGTAFFGKENKIVKYTEIFGDFYLGIFCSVSSKNIRNFRKHSQEISVVQNLAEFLVEWEVWENETFCVK